MRISDWSSDVCSSDLAEVRRRIQRARLRQQSLRRETRGELRQVQGGRRGRGAGRGANRARQAREAGEGRIGAAAGPRILRPGPRSEEHTSELQSLMRISYAGFCLNKKQQDTT